jgi:hypothetical protein
MARKAGKCKFPYGEIAQSLKQWDSTNFIDKSSLRRKRSQREQQMKNRRYFSFLKRMDDV